MAKAKTKNERITEALVRAALSAEGYYDEDAGTLVEEQKSGITAVRRSLKNASKTGGGGIGSPEFIITDADDTNFVILVECKASEKDHSSARMQSLASSDDIEEDNEQRAKRITKFAVDGVLHYAEALSREFTVIAIAVSGQSKATLLVSTYLHTRHAAAPKELTTRNGDFIDRVLPWDDYVEHATYDPSVQRLRWQELMAFSRQLHDFMRDHAKLTEGEKPLLVSGTLLALQNEPFALSYDAYDPASLQKQWLAVIKSEIEKADIPKAKKADMVQPYSGISVSPVLGRKTKDYPKGVLNELIRLLNEKVRPFISVYNDFDVVGQFYGEFLKYTGGDKKALGIVLTPRHITELFSLIANVQKNDRVLDPCCGTGGFLISAMHQMMKQAATEGEKTSIKAEGLVGVENLPNMFALAASNMILRGDGKANLYQGSCFDKSVIKAVMERQCTVGMINPPYSQADEDLHELEFVRNMMDCLVEGGTGIAIVPMQCAIAPDHPSKRALLKGHTLEAVMSMPDDLFYPVGTVTCIMVLTAHKPHVASNKKTWFGYWKADSFVRTKHMGRVDLRRTWPAIRDRWVEAYRNRDDLAGFSIKRKVSAADEWCAEAYMETDYGRLSEATFAREVKKYLLFGLHNEAAERELPEDDSSTSSIQSGENI